MEEIWGVDIESDERTVDVHIKRIREKLSDFNEFKKFELVAWYGCNIVRWQR